MIYCAAAIVLLFLAGVYFAYRKAFYVPLSYKEDIYRLPEGEQYDAVKDISYAMIREAAQIPFEPVNIIAYDGKSLYGRYYHTKDGAPVQIQMHGYRSSALCDFCGGVKMACTLGHNVLLVDQRAHGQSRGRTISFGVKERFDCLSWVNYACSRFGDNVPIVLSGISMGAATVLMAVELDLPENVRCIVADSPYTSPADIIKKTCSDMGLPVKLAYPFVFLGALIFGHFRLDGASAAEAVGHAKIPAIIFHGEADTCVPCEMSRRLYEAYAGEKTLATFPGADHVLSYMQNKERYISLFNDFLSKNIPV